MMLSEADTFSSVFRSSATSHTTPTPLSTPLIGGSVLGQSFGLVSSPAKQPPHSSVAQLQVKKNLAWSAVTRYLSLDGLSLDEISSSTKHAVNRRRRSREVEEALVLLLALDGDDFLSHDEWNLVGQHRSHYHLWLN